jgi:ribosomal protein S18 acetylase RimI-like enzyme
MHVHEATTDDLDQLSPLFDDYRIFYDMPSDQEQSRQFLKERLEQKQSVIYCVSEQNNICGFTQLYPLFTSTRLKKLWLLNDLYVAPPFRGSGISIKLIDAAKNHAVSSGSAGLILETARNNDIANSLYRRTGFALDSDHHYYTWNSL